MKNRLFALLLSAILLLTMIPFAFASSADPVDGGVVQGSNDAVVIFRSAIGSFQTMGAKFKDNKVNGTAYDRVILVLGADSTYANGHFGYTNTLSGTESFVVTSKCTVTDPDKTFECDVSNAYACSAYEGSAGLLNWFDNADASQNVKLSVGDANSNTALLICHCAVEWDYITVKELGANVVFYLCYYDATFGAHYVNEPAGNGSSATHYPVLVNGREGKNSGSSNKTSTFSGTQTINVLGSTWAYLAPSSRDAKVTMNGTINVNLKNATFKMEQNVDTGAPNSTVMMARDIFTANAQINVTVEGCSFKQFALFGASGNNSTQYSAITNAGQLSVTLNGANSFDRGIENLRYNKDFAAILQSGASLTLNINGYAALNGKTVDGLDNDTLTSTVNYSEIYADTDALLHFDNRNDSADFTGYALDANGAAIVYMNNTAPESAVGSGKTAADPVRALEQAFRVLRGAHEKAGTAAGGTVILSDACWVNAYTYPDLGGTVTIQGTSSGLFVVRDHQEFKNDVVFKNVNFGETQYLKAILMSDNDLTFDHCGYYENEGDSVPGNPPVKGNPSSDPRLVVSAAARVNATNNAGKDNRVLNQTVTVIGNDDGFALYRICAAYKAGLNSETSYAPLPGETNADTSSGCTGEVNVVIGENASVGIIDTITSDENTYAVNVTLPAEQMDGVELRSTNDAGTAATVIYTTDAANVQTWLKASVGFDKMGTYGYSLRAKNTAGKFAMRAGFTAPAAALDNAAEYGVLVKRTANPTALTWFDNGYHPGVTEAPAVQTYNNGVGKSVVYLNPILDNADKDELTAEGRYLFSCPVVFTTLNAETADYEYTFTPYIAYGILVDGAQSFYYAYGTDESCTIAASLNDMIGVVGGAIADAITAEING